MAVCLGKRPAPSAGSTPLADSAARGPRTSRLRSDEAVQLEAARVQATTRTPATADGLRHRSCAQSNCTLVESPAPAATLAAPLGIAETLPMALCVVPEGQADGAAAVEAAQDIIPPPKPLPPVSAAALCARVETWDWAATDIPTPPDRRCAAERCTAGLLVRASEALDLLCKARHAYILSESSAFLSKLLTWIVADALGCPLPDSDTAFRKGKALSKYIKGQAARVAGIEKQARADAAKTGASKPLSHAQQQVDDLYGTDSPYASAPEFTAPETATAPSELSEDEAADRAFIAEAAARAEALEIAHAPRLLTLRPAPRLDSYTKDISDEVREELDKAGSWPPAITFPQGEHIYSRHPIYARELVDYAFGDAETCKSRVHTFAEHDKWQAVEKELAPVTPSDYPEMLVEMYYRAQETEFELRRERDMFERLYDFSQKREEKLAHAYFGGHFLSHIDQAKERLEKAHQREIESLDQLKAQWGSLEPFLPPSDMSP